MFKEERHNCILEILAKTGRIVGKDFARIVGVSDDTIRRDIIELENHKKLIRVHGGALHVPGIQPGQIRQPYDINDLIDKLNKTQNQ